MELFFLFVLAETIIYYTLSQLKLYFEVLYHRTTGDDELIVKIMIFKSVELYSMCIPAIEFTASRNTLLPWIKAEITAGNEEPYLKTHTERERRFVKKSIKVYALSPKRLHLALRVIHNLFDVYNDFMRKIISSLRCEYLSWNTTCGTGDAATTALLTGFLWSVKGTALERIKSHSAFNEQPIIHIQPDWGKTEFTTAFQCIFSIQIGHVITAVLKSFLIRNKGVIGNGGASNSRVNENRHGKY